MKRGRRALLVVLVLVAATIAAVSALRREGAPAPLPVEGGSPAPALPPSRPAWVTTGGATPIPTAQVVLAAAREDRCVQGRVVDTVTAHGVSGATVRFTPELEVTTGPDGSFAARPATPRLRLEGVSAEGYFPFSGGVELWLTPGTCASGLVVPLVPKLVRRGRVVDEEDRPLRGARVTITDSDERPASSVVSDAEGRFTFSAHDGARLEARLDGFVPAVSLLDFRAMVSGELLLVLGRLADGGALPGSSIAFSVVVEETGAPLAGAELVAWRDTKEGPVEVARLSEAGSSGTLKVDGPGPWLVEARAKGQPSDLVATDGAPVTLRIGAGATLVGHVHDEQGKPVSGFTVSLREKRGALALGAAEDHHVLDARGEFELGGLPSGTFDVSVTALGLAPSEPREVRLAPGLAARADFVLHPGGAVTGRVFDRQSRQPIPGAVVSLEGSDDGMTLETSSTRTADDGRFTLNGLRPGRRSLFAAADGHHARLVTVIAEPARVAGPIDLALTPVEQGDAPRLELVGIGAVLEARGDALVITSVLPGGGASEVGLVVGDAILSIEGQLAVNLGFTGGIELIRGEEGTTVLLSVRRANGALVDVRVPRRVISSP